MRTNERAGGDRLPAFFLVVRWIHESIYRRVGWIGWVRGAVFSLGRWCVPRFIKMAGFHVCAALYIVCLQFHPARHGILHVSI